jgi:hypothetical protein
MGKAAKKEASKRVPFNWVRLKSMWDQGKSHLEMAKSLDSHFNPEGDDPTKSIRAKCSVAMNKGVMIDGKLVKFVRRNNSKKAMEPKKAAPKKATKRVSKRATPRAKPHKKAVPKPIQKQSSEAASIEPRPEA